jgi:DNA repair protein RadC
MVTEPEKKKNKFALGGSVEQTGLFDNYTPVKPTIISKKPKKEQGILENQISEVDVVRLGVTTLPSEKNKKIMSSNDAVKILYDVFPKEQIAVQEFYYVLFLNNNNSVIAYYNLSKGGVTSTIADIELIASAGVKLLAKGVIVAHNHPSGNLKPSDADINISKETRKALKLLGILLMDSIIIVPNGDLNGYKLNGYKYTSLIDEGLI